MVEKSGVNRWRGVAGKAVGRDAVQGDVGARGGREVDAGRGLALDDEDASRVRPV